MSDFRKLRVWEKAHEMVLLVYKLTSKFPSEEKFGLTSQLRRATSSVPTNIAEGTGRFSEADQARFFEIAHGSLIEVEYLILLSFDLGYLAKEDFDQLGQLMDEVRAMLRGMINKKRTKSYSNS